MATFKYGLKPFVHSKLIEHTIGRDIGTLEELIITTSLTDNTLYGAQRESHGATLFSCGSNASSNGKKSITGCSSSFVPPEIRQKRGKAGHYPKCGDPAHKFEQCKNEWTLKLTMHNLLTAKAANLTPSLVPTASLPDNLQEFNKVFGEDCFSTLPPHRPYDCGQAMTMHH
ncbi:hypothetical protein FRC07_009158 [Ceratobasidium sp. 392]|nr:hypothetical protein FRC07_009158 [Ceratobasidium sp. 392]